MSAVREDRTFSQPSIAYWQVPVNSGAVLAVLTSALVFNFALSFANARGFNISNFHVIGCEAAIIAAAALLAAPALNNKALALIVGTIWYVLALAIARTITSPETGLDVKIVRDFIIPPLFFLVGYRISNLKTADRIVWILACGVLAVAAFEYLFLDAYIEYFNPIRYYIARGTVEDTEQALLSANSLMVSGIRPEDQGRAILPFLGNHRVSSVFLEPSSLGNFGVIIALWGVARLQSGNRIELLTILVGITAIILADTRFGAVFLLLGVILMLLPIRLSTISVAVLPFVVLTGLIVLGLFVDWTSDEIENNLWGRLSYAAAVLHAFDALNWLGLKVSPLQTFDAGYAFVLSGIGIVGMFVYWVIFLRLRGSERPFYAFRNAMGAYFAIFLSISQSQTTIKTASLLWFLLGALAAAGPRLSAVAPSISAPLAAKPSHRVA